MSPTKTRWLTIGLALVVLVLITGRFLLLDADVPPWFAPGDLGLHLDDGYKSLAARNLVEFGTTHWHPEDDYPGWYRASPLTQRLYRSAFSIGGVRLASIRVVGVLWFVATIAVFVATFRRVYASWVLATGALLLSLEPMLYHFSRVALFEVPLGFFLVLGCLAVYRARGGSVQVLMLFLAAGLAWRLVKPSGYLYMAPGLLALPLLHLWRMEGKPRSWSWTIGLGGLAAMVLLLVATRRFWMANIYLDDPAWLVQRLLNSGLQACTPLIMAAALLCIVHGIATRPRAYLFDAYRVVLVSTLLGVPLILACFQTPPPRFYTALVFCAPLLVVDHIGRGSWRWRGVGATPFWSRLLVAALSVLLVWYLLRALDYAVLRRLPSLMGDSPGILSITMYRFFAPVAGITFMAAFLLPGRFSGSRFTPPLLGALLAVFVALGVTEQIRTLTSPTFDGQHVREELVRVTSPQAIIGGDWAPLLTLGTGRRCLYVNDVFNPAERFPLLRPDYFLNAESWRDDLNLKTLRQMSEVVLGEPLTLGSMLGRPITLIPLSYPRSSGAAPSSAGRDGAEGR